MVGWLVQGSRQKGGLRRQKSALWPCGCGCTFESCDIYLETTPTSHAVSLARLSPSLAQCCFFGTLPHALQYN